MSDARSFVTPSEDCVDANVSVRSCSCIVFMATTIGSGEP